MEASDTMPKISESYVDENEDNKCEDDDYGTTTARAFRNLREQEIKCWQSQELKACADWANEILGKQQQELRGHKYDVKKSGPSTKTEENQAPQKRKVFTDRTNDKMKNRRKEMRSHNADDKRGGPNIDNQPASTVKAYADRINKKIKNQQQQQH